MSDQGLSFLRAATSAAPGFTILSEDNPISFSVGRLRYSVHVSAVHDSGEGRDNDDEQRIQVPRRVLDIQRQRRAQGYVVLFIGFFPDGAAFTAWEPDYVLSQRPDRNGSVYARRSHGRLAQAQGAAVRVVRRTRYLGRPTSVVTLPARALPGYLDAWPAIHRATSAAEVRRIIEA